MWGNRQTTQRNAAMALYRLVVLTNAVDGRDADYNTWYTDQHLSDVLKVPGFVGAQRFKLVATMTKGSQFEYLAIYDVETDDPVAAVAALKARSASGTMVMSDALDRNVYSMLYQPITELVTRQN
jgi:hypothetical protein